ncbi:MAG TPA: vWA domain-containing protein [Thermoanaerobaculia bacterium]|nr:vWA domain-containing protein [Thermoanaerobaculia bacterium]
MKQISAALLFLLIAVSAVADESWLLDIPVRGIPDQETGQVRLVMGLSAAPSGAQLIVNGTTTLNLGGSATVNGDNVAFAAGSGNQIVITYKPLSNFGADFCAGGGAIEKQIPMRFVGPQDIVDYRITSYIVGAPAAECSQVSKHTGDTPANVQIVGDGVAPALSATFKGRNDFDVVLVLDKSGSMADNPPGAVAPPSKASILNAAVQGFVSQWEQLDAPPGGGPEWSGDRLGVVFFDSSAVSQTLAGADPPANFFLQRGNATAWDAVINKVATLQPGNYTSIGGGINEAMKQWKSDPKNDLSLVVVTDGMQNTLPLILPTASGFLGLDPVSGLPQELRKRFIPIQTIGFGQPDQIDEDLLRNIAYETSGVSYVSATATTMFDVFGQTLVALLKGNTASLTLRRIATITDKGPTQPRGVFVDRSAQRIVFSLQWPPPFKNALSMEVFKPATSAPAQPTSFKSMPQIDLRTFDRPAPGEWLVRIRRGIDQKVQPIPYTLHVFVLERHLDYRLSFPKIHAVTGDKLTIRAVVAWDGKPMTGLPEGAIRVRVQRPSEALGTVLHETRDVSTTPAPGADAKTPAQQKIASIKGLSERVAPKDVVTIALEEERNGLYSATFDQTAIPGAYAFEAVLDWENEHTGHVHREERLEQNVAVKTDPAKTIVETRETKPGLWSVTVIPRDKFGNYLGPGYAHAVKARLRSAVGSISEVAEDPRQTGDYTFLVRGAATKPEVVVTVDGVLIGR